MHSSSSFYLLFGYARKARAEAAHGFGAEILG
jgi:hypothetical protein